MQTITNKFLIMNNCKQCDTEGLVSTCCNSIVHFMASGAAKCSKCKKFTKLKPCDSCKEENSIQIIPVNKHQNNSSIHLSILNELLPHTIPSPMSKTQKVFIIVIILSYLLIFFLSYLLM